MKVGILVAPLRKTHTDPVGTAVEWNFVQGLLFKQHTPEDSEFIRMMYTIRLRKVS